MKKTTQNKIVIPIRTLSQLFRTQANQWIATKKNLDKAEGPMFAYYAPMVHAMNAEIRQKGSGRLILDLEVQGFGDNPTSKSVIQNSSESFKFFAENWAERFQLIEEFPEKGRDYEYVNFEGHLLKGGFHARALEYGRDEVFLYYHASNWTPMMVRAQAELLAIIGEVRHGISRESIRFLDFREKSILRYKWPTSNLRRDLKTHCDLYQLVFKKR